MPRGQRDKQREQQKKERQRQQRAQATQAAAAAPAENPAVAALIEQLAERLGESDPLALGQLERIVRQIDRERVLALLDQTLAIEAQGGQLIADGTRRRTTGGVFFNLVRRQLSKAERMAIFFPEHESVTVLNEAELGALLAGCAQWPRAVPERVRLQISGRPTHIPPPNVPPDTPYVVLTMVGQAALPIGVGHGLPPIPHATTFRVLMATKQWLTLAPKLLARADARLLVLGSPALGAKRPDIITVRASRVLLTYPRHAAAPPAEAE